MADLQGGVPSVVGKTVVNPRSGSTFSLGAISHVPEGSVATGDELKLGNSLIQREVEDVLYHLGLSNFTSNLHEMFHDVKFVCMGGSAVRMEVFANILQKRLKVKLPTGLGLVPIGKTERFSMFKVGPVIVVSHGMGMPSISILLHEITKLLFHASASDVTFIRVGTSGGLGIPGGTVVISTEGVNGKLESNYEQIILGNVVNRSTILDLESANLAAELAKGDGESLIAIPTVLGKTMGTDDFYEGQARMDGAVCEYTYEQRSEFLVKAHEIGVRNIEMEVPCFAAWCNRLNIRGMACCAVLLNRLVNDQVTSTPEQLAQFSLNAQEVTIRFIEHKLRVHAIE